MPQEGECQLFFKRKHYFFYIFDIFIYFIYQIQGINKEYAASLKDVLYL